MIAYCAKLSAVRLGNRARITVHLLCLVDLESERNIQGGHDTGKTGNLVLTFSRQGKHREFGSDTGKNLLTQGKYLDCDY